MKVAESKVRSTGKKPSSRKPIASPVPEKHVSTANSVAAAGAALGTVASLLVLPFAGGSILGAVIGLAAGKMLGEVVEHD